VPDYREIFEQRGRLYHRAMETYPGSRAQEFRSVVAAADIAPGMTVVDVPSGGAYLADYLPAVTLVGLESSPAFAELASKRADTVLLYDENTFPLASNSVDRVLSIAGLHHVEDKRQIFAEMHRVVKAEGRIVLADVAAESAVSRFLDEFVGQYNVTGHSGWYFGDATRRELHDAGLGVAADEVLSFRWYADERVQLADFCRTLFGMVAADTDTVVEGIGDYLGWHQDDSGWGMNWALRCISCSG